MLFLQEALMATDDPRALDFGYLLPMLDPDDIGCNLKFVKKVQFHENLLLGTFCFIGLMCLIGAGLNNCLAFPVYAADVASSTL
jgi:hypothetical protein